VDPPNEFWQVCVQLLRTLTTWHSPHSPAAAAAIDRNLLLAEPTAANLQRRLCGSGGSGPVLGETDERTPYRHIDPSPHTVRAVVKYLMETCGRRATMNVGSKAVSCFREHPPVVETQQTVQSEHHPDQRHHNWRSDLDGDLVVPWLRPLSETTTTVRPAHVDREIAVLYNQDQLQPRSAIAKS